MISENKTIYTIGHSTRSFEELALMLHAFNITLVADVRNYPGSRKYPQFNKEALEISLPQTGIQYVHLEELADEEKQIRIQRIRPGGMLPFADMLITWKQQNSKREFEI